MTNLTKLLEGLSEDQAKQIVTDAAAFIRKRRAEIEGKPAPPSELAITATRTHLGMGGVATESRRRGYTASRWRTDEVRVLPRKMAEDLLASGGFRVAQEGDLRIPDMDRVQRGQAKPKTVEEIAAVFANEPKIRAVGVWGTKREGGGWKDGILTTAWEAAGYPGEWLRTEIRDVPISLLRRVDANAYSADPKAVAEHEARQDYYVNRRAQWAHEMAEKRETAQRRYVEQEINRRVAQQKELAQRRTEQELRDQIAKEMTQ